MVNMVLKRGDGSQYDIEGKLYDSVDIDMIIDGYNAPITGMFIGFDVHCQIHFNVSIAIYRW